MQSRQQPSPTPPYSLHRRPMVFSPDKPDETSTAPEASAPAATPVSSSIKHLLGGLTLGAVSWDKARHRLTQSSLLHNRRLKYSKTADNKSSLSDKYYLPPLLQKQSF